MRFLRRVGLLVATFAVVVVGFVWFVRPWYLSWGATAEEQTMSLPGDEIVPDAGTQNTRAITIAAPIERVWPWLAQIGQDRAGFYSFRRLENLVGCEMPDATTLLPGKQDWRLGDKLWMYPPSKAGGIGFATLRVYVPGRVLGFATRMSGTRLDEPENGSWTFVLSPIDAESTRLIIRGRGTANRNWLGTMFDRAAFEPAHYVMERRMMLGLAGVATGHPRSSFDDDVQVVLWVITFALIGAAKALVIFREHWQRPLVGFASSLVVFQVLTLAQPHILVGALLVAGVAAVLWWPEHAHEHASV